MTAKRLRSTLIEELPGPDELLVRRVVTYTWDDGSTTSDESLVPSPEVEAFDRVLSNVGQRLSQERRGAKPNTPTNFFFHERFGDLTHLRRRP